MVDELHLIAFVGVQDGAVEFDESAVLPECPRPAGIQPETAGDFRQQIVAVRVRQVPRGDLSSHVPAIKGRGPEIRPSDPESHIGDRRHGVPPEAEFGEAGVVRMFDHDFLNEILRERKEVRSSIGARENPRQQV